MSKNHFSPVISAVLLFSSCATQDVKHAVGQSNTEAAVQNASASNDAPPIPKDGDYPGKGKVTKINTELVSVELDHEEIVGLMPRMIMEFYVRDASLLDGVKVGDNVEFILEYKHPSETIVGLKKIK